MLMIFSRHSNSSEQVLREVQLAVDCRLPIIRFRLEDIPLSDDLRYYLSAPHYLDALSHPVSKHIPPLTAAIKELLGPSADQVKDTTAVPPPMEAVGKHRTSATDEKSAVKWKPFAIGAVLLALGLAITFWALRSERKSEVAAPVAPIPRQTTRPSPSASVLPVISDQPTMTSTPVLTTPSPSPIETTPEAKPSPTVKLPDKKGPMPRANRTWQVWIDEFVRNFIASNESNDIDLAVSFYAPSVDLFEEGRKPKDSIQRDIESYNARWPSRRATIRGDVRLGEKAANHNYTASFEHDYYVENASRGEWINGAVAVDLLITVEGEGVPRIVSMKQKTLRKEKGTMQLKPATQTDQSPEAAPASATASPLPSPPPPSVLSPPPSPEQNDLDSTNPHLTRVTNTRYGFSILIPQNVFPIPEREFATDRQVFTSNDGRAVLTLYIEPQSSKRLRARYEEWAAERTKTEPDKIVDYKVLRDNWFVVSGQKGDRGFYLKAVAKGDVLEFMRLDCEENHYPVNGTTLTAMSRSFDGN
jgi:hypothetical protein